MKNIKEINWKSLNFILTAAAALLAIVAFFFAFASPMTTSVGSQSSNLAFDKVYFPENGNAAPLGFVGFVLALVAGLAICCSSFVKDPIGKFVKIGALAVLLLAVIFMFCAVANYKSANADLVKFAEAAGTKFKLGAGPIVGGIFGIAGIGCGCASVVLK